jgi:inner membrane transporter RhtA
MAATGQLAAPRRNPLSRVPSPALVVTGICSVQTGAAIAIRLFAQTGAAGTVLLRLAMATIILLIIWRPSIRALTRRQIGLILLFGLVLGAMNLTFYEAIARIPLGIAVAIEFLGPLAVAVAGSRRASDLIWVALAAGGVVALTQGGSHGLDTWGVVLVVIAGGAWACYILMNVRLGRAFTDGSGLALAMVIASLLVLGPGVADGGSRLLSGHSLLVGAAIGLLSSAVPYSLEMETLRRISPRVFGVLMSLEPAVAALSGFLILGQGLSLREVIGIGLVVAASAGASRDAAAVDAVPPPTA